MVRKLKHHEKKLLKKFDFLNYKCDNNIHELKILRKFYIQKREDYTIEIREIAEKLKKFEADDSFRSEMTSLLLNKLYSLGLIQTKTSLLQVSRISASCFCRRRLPCVIKRANMSETLKAAVTFIEQGHVRVGTDTIRDPAFLVPRSMEDYVTWAPGSKIKQKLQDYSGLRDDYNDV